MFGLLTRKDLQELLGVEEGKDNQVSELKKRVSELKEEIEGLKVKKTMEEREITHLVKLKEEKQEIEAEKERIKLQGEFQTKEMNLMKDFHNKTLDLLEKKSKELGEIHSEILKRLPDM